MGKKEIKCEWYQMTDSSKNTIRNMPGEWYDGNQTNNNSGNWTDLNNYLAKCYTGVDNSECKDYCGAPWGSRTLDIFKRDDAIYKKYIQDVKELVNKNLENKGIFEAAASSVRTDFGNSFNDWDKFPTDTEFSDKYNLIYTNKRDNMNVKPLSGANSKNTKNYKDDYTFSIQVNKNLWWETEKNNIRAIVSKNIQNNINSEMSKISILSVPDIQLTLPNYGTVFNINKIYDTTPIATSFNTIIEMINKDTFDAAASANKLSKLQNLRTQQRDNIKQAIINFIQARIDTAISNIVSSANIEATLPSYTSEISNETIYLTTPIYISYKNILSMINTGITEDNTIKGQKLSALERVETSQNENINTAIQNFIDKKSVQIAGLTPMSKEELAAVVSGLPENVSLSENSKISIMINITPIGNIKNKINNVWKIGNRTATNSQVTLSAIINAKYNEQLNILNSVYEDIYSAKKREIETHVNTTLTTSANNFMETDWIKNGRFPLKETFLGPFASYANTFIDKYGSSIFEFAKEKSDEVLNTTYSDYKKRYIDDPDPFDKGSLCYRSTDVNDTKTVCDDRRHQRCIDQTDWRTPSVFQEQCANFYKTLDDKTKNKEFCDKGIVETRCDTLEKSFDNVCQTIGSGVCDVTSKTDSLCRKIDWKTDSPFQAECVNFWNNNRDLIKDCNESPLKDRCTTLEANLKDPYCSTFFCQRGPMKLDSITKECQTKKYKQADPLQDECVALWSTLKNSANNSLLPEKAGDYVPSDNFFTEKCRDAQNIFTPNGCGALCKIYPDACMKERYNICTTEKAPWEDINSPISYQNCVGFLKAPSENFKEKFEETKSSIITNSATANLKTSETTNLQAPAFSNNYSFPTDSTWFSNVCTSKNDSIFTDERCGALCSKYPSKCNEIKDAFCNKPGNIDYKNSAIVLNKNAKNCVDFFKSYPKASSKTFEDNCPPSSDLFSLDEKGNIIPSEKVCGSLCEVFPDKCNELKNRFCVSRTLWESNDRVLQDYCSKIIKSKGFTGFYADACGPPDSKYGVIEDPTIGCYLLGEKFPEELKAAQADYCNSKDVSYSSPNAKADICMEKVLMVNPNLPSTVFDRDCKNSATLYGQTDYCGRLCNVFRDSCDKYKTDFCVANVNSVFNPNSESYSRTTAADCASRIRTINPTADQLFSIPVETFKETFASDFGGAIADVVTLSRNEASKSSEAAMSLGYCYDNPSIMTSGALVSGCGLLCAPIQENSEQDKQINLNYQRLCTNMRLYYCNKNPTDPQCLSQTDENGYVKYPDAKKIINKILDFYTQNTLSDVANEFSKYRTDSAAKSAAINRIIVKQLSETFLGELMGQDVYNYYNTYVPQLMAFIKNTVFEEIRSTINRVKELSELPDTITIPQTGTFTYKTYTFGPYTFTPSIDMRCDPKNPYNLCNPLGLDLGNKGRIKCPSNWVDNCPLK